MTSTAVAPFSFKVTWATKAVEVVKVCKTCQSVKVLTPRLKSCICLIQAFLPSLHLTFDGISCHSVAPIILPLAGHHSYTKSCKDSAVLFVPAQGMVKANEWIPFAKLGRQPRLHGRTAPCSEAVWLFSPHLQ